MLRIYNTLTRKKDEFKPLVDGQVSFYVCGVTVYDVCHIGHARAYVVFDMMRRHLLTRGYTVNYVQNFTDIDDKIIDRANKNGESVTELTSRNIEAYKQDMAALNIMPASQYTHATAFISEMQKMIQVLLDKGVAYELNGDVCFSVETFESYGALSKKVIDDLLAGIRVELNDKKKNPLDFVLWKASKSGEPSWESPWGPGRPGWHIECSAMAIHALGKTIDIHGGGEDLIFPHHENEIAQSESVTGQLFVRYWVHNGFVNIDKTKMSKSLGNVITIKNILDRYDGDVLRFYLLRVHYRTPLRFSYEGMDEAATALDRLRLAISSCNDQRSEFGDSSLDREGVVLEKKFYAMLDDDFNSGAAVGVLFELLRFVNRHDCGGGVLKRLMSDLGFLDHLLSENDALLSDDIQALIDQREIARKQRDFSSADRIRDQLLGEYGILLEDSRDGVRVKWKD